MRIYLDQKEICEMPELAVVCQEDETFQAFLDWLKVHRPSNSGFDAIISLESTDLEEGKVLEVWVPEAPHMRAQQIGGILKSFTRGES